MTALVVRLSLCCGSVRRVCCPQLVPQLQVRRQDGFTSYWRVVILADRISQQYMGGGILNKAWAFWLCEIRVTRCVRVFASSVVRVAVLRYCRFAFYVVQVLGLISRYCLANSCLASSWL